MRWLFFLLLFSGPAMAESFVALRTIPARAVLSAADMTSVQAEIAGAVTDPQLVVGREARITVFAGRPIRSDDFVAPALVNRNQLVALIYVQGALEIGTEGRALDRGGAGEAIRVMNLGSRTIVTGVVTAPGVVSVGPITERD
jgi:flagellar basal body P-ring formation protein FlgA